MKIAVIGTGYVGLVTGACLSNAGNHVVCVDKDDEKVELLNGGGIPIYEEGLENIVERNREDGRLEFTTDAERAVQASDIIFIAVGTPPDEDGSADLQHVLAVAETIGTHMNGHKIVVCKSTVPVGTCDKVAETISNVTDEPFDVASNPEFLKEGTAVKDFQSPDRVVIGCNNQEAAETLAELYRPFMRRNERIVHMDVRSAEMTKYASNAMLATKISFINEVATLCDEVGADVEKVRRGMSMDDRIGPHFIYPGVGFGGSCFPKDIRALERLGKEVGLRMNILESVHEVNTRQKLRLFHAAKAHFDSLEDKTLAVWGLSFKPRTDDVREAPALVNIRKFVEEGAAVSATDPEAIDNARRDLADLGDQIQFTDDDYKTLEGADALFIFTEWEEFRSPDFQQLKTLMKTPIIFDGRNLFQPEKMEKLGITYICIGRPQVNT